MRPLEQLFLRLRVRVLGSPSGSFEFIYAEIGLGTTSVTGGVEMAFEDSWAHYCVHHFNQDGIIRG